MAVSHTDICVANIAVQRRRFAPKKTIFAVTEKGARTMSKLRYIIGIIITLVIVFLFGYLVYCYNLVR